MKRMFLVLSTCLSFVIFLSVQVFAQPAKNPEGHGQNEPDTSKHVALDEVVIRSKRPVIFYESDRFRVDVKAMNTRGDQATDLLGRIPGVKLDRDGVLSLQGKTNVLVYINGKQSYLTGKALLSYLKSLPAGDIAAIEFLTNPPASYDAAGSGGVIDIQLRKRSGDGLTLNTTLAITPLEKTRSALTGMATGRWQKWQGYGQLSIDHSPTFKLENIDRQAAEDRFQQENNSFSYPTDLTGMLGINYQLPANQVVGLDARMMGGWERSQVNGKYMVINAAETFQIDLRQNGQEQAQRNAFHLFYSWTIDTLGSALTVDGDYYQNKRNQRDQLSNVYILSPTNSKLNANQAQFRSTDIYALKIDWVQKLKFASLESGVKVSHVANANSIELDSLLGFEQVARPGFSNAFQYFENVQAAYLTLHRPSRHLDVNAGVRYEYTSGSDKGGQFVNRRYGYIFPSASLTSRLGLHQITFSYRKSIIRPVYTNLNPFTYYTDAFNAVSGNPGINPALAHIGEMNYIFKDARLLTVNFIQMRDATVDVLTFDANQQVNRARPESIGKLQTLYIATGQALKLARIWSVSTDVAGLYNRIIKPTNRGQWSMTAQVGSDWQFKRGWSASLLAKYASPMLYELSNLSSVGTISIGLKKLINGGKGFIALDCNDIFYGDREKSTYSYGALHQQTLTKWQSRIARIAFSYMFGSSKVAMNSNRDIAPDEIERIK